MGNLRFIAACDIEGCVDDGLVEVKNRARGSPADCRYFFRIWIKSNAEQGFDGVLAVGDCFEEWIVDIDKTCPKVICGNSGRLLPLQVRELY